jgi:hypothetical protein
MSRPEKAEIPSRCAGSVFAGPRSINIQQKSAMVQILPLRARRVLTPAGTETTDVMRRQGDGLWLFASDNPWGVGG